MPSKLILYYCVTFASLLKSHLPPKHHLTLTGQPTGQPSGQPSTSPTGQPTSNPSMAPTNQVYQRISISLFQVRLQFHPNLTSLHHLSDLSDCTEFLVTLCMTVTLPCSTLPLHTPSRVATSPLDSASMASAMGALSAVLLMPCSSCPLWLQSSDTQ